MYMAEVTVTEHFHIDAETLEEAFDKAAKEAADVFDVDLHQVSVNFAKEVN